MRSSPSRLIVRPSVAALLALAVTVPMAASASDIDRIDLPPGWQAEGVTSDGTTLYAGSLADGAIWKGDALTGEGDVLVEGGEGVSVGLDVESGAGRLWVAGGPGGTVVVYDTETGELLETYPFEAGFLNDVIVTDTAVYVTDSFIPQLIVIPLSEDGAVPLVANAKALPYSGDVEYADGFNLNGIEATDAGLVVVHTPTGELFRVDPATAETTRIDIGDADITFGDGLELDGSTLYVIRNQVATVAALELDEGATTATLTAELTAPDLDVPTTAAMVDGSLWAANARFGTDVTPDTEYWLTRLDTVGEEG
jgi:outer membrane protein assembly factor BamB